jgi:hypothetical protein
MGMGGGGVGEKRGVKGVRQKGKAEKGERKNSVERERKGSGKEKSIGRVPRRAFPANNT